jgi:hypothetical protein
LDERPTEVALDAKNTVKALSIGLEGLQKGSHATIYSPASHNTNEAQESLLFEVEVVDWH